MTTISQLEAHGIPVTAMGEGIHETKTVVHDVDQLRSLLDLGLDQQGRQAHYEAMFAGIQPAATPDDEALSRRIAAHVVGNADLSAEDRAAIAPAFPLTVHVTAAPTPITVNSMYDLSTPDGSMRIASFSSVTLEQGGYFVCESTPLSFTCDTLTRTGDTGTSDSDFNILGRMGVTPQTPQPPGAPGQASSGSPGDCTSAGIAGSSGGPGNPGKNGTDGTAGTHGNNGTPSMQATITISQTLTGSISVYSTSGAGGLGGDGGAGGPGGAGGNGGNGATCGCTGSAGGSGGDGGQGGNGGAAGDGGNGVNAAGNVTVRVPNASDVKNVKTKTDLAPYGDAGQRGPGGQGGAGGYGGSGGKDNAGGGNGGQGGPGAYGASGSSGTATGKAAQINVMPV